jgi:hypothetical protein
MDSVIGHNILTMRKIFSTLALIGFGFISPYGISYAMGGQASSVGAPVSAKIVDITGKTHTATNFVCDDKNYFVFRDGAAEVKVPFSVIKKVEINQSGNKLTAKVVFKNGKAKTFEIEPDTVCDGTTEFGVLEIYINKIKEIDFLTK